MLGVGASSRLVATARSTATTVLRSLATASLTTETIPNRLDSVDTHDLESTQLGIMRQDISDRAREKMEAQRTIPEEPEPTLLDRIIGLFLPYLLVVALIVVKARQVVDAVRSKTP